MKNKTNEIWVGAEQLKNDPSYQETANQEFVELPIVEQLGDDRAIEAKASRRDFLKYMGFGLGAATIAASCEIPVKRAIPYVSSPDEIVPGVATYYASTYVKGSDYCSVLVKTREGRPIKIEGNSLSKVTMGGTSARAQASVLSLYDTTRFVGPGKVEEGKVDKEATLSWEEIDAEIKEKLTPGARIRVVANTIMSPTTKKALEEFTAKYPNTEVVMYDPVSSAAMLEANEQSFGQRIIPNYHFDKAEVIVSFDADFLGTWISPIEYSAQYITKRKVNPENPKLSRHIQVESHMSLTGSNADNRIMVKPSEQGAAIVALYNEVARLTGGSTVSGPNLPADKLEKIKKAAQELANHRGSSLVVAGSNNTAEQVLINGINYMLQNYGATIDFTQASLQRQGLDKDVQRLIREMNGNQVDVLMVMDGANPAWDLPNSERFRAGMEKVGTKISFSGTPNETALLCNYITPTHHFLESWGDAQPKLGHYSLIQPTISPLFNTRQAEESMLRWAESENLNTEAEQPMYEYLKWHWETELFPRQNNFATFQAFWDNTLHDGVLELPTEGKSFDFVANVSASAANVSKPSNAELEISFMESVNVGAGQFANNPWLMEMPDPINRTVWGNYLAIPIGWDGGNEFNSFKNLNQNEVKGKADIVEMEVNGVSANATVVRQFGQMEGTLSMVLGHGRDVTSHNGNGGPGTGVGVNVYPWLNIDEFGNTQYYSTKVEVGDVVEVEDYFACVQYHHSMGVTGTSKDTGEKINVDEKTATALSDPFNPDGFQGGIVDRSIIFKGNVEELPELVHHIEERRAEAQELNSHTLYPYDTYLKDVYSQGHHWAMHIDLNACIGCGACQVACVAENNVPVVGKTEVARHHEMTWLRIDRYFYGDFENPNVVYQPMMCQHCDNAPCENVCPVAATNHSSEGLNQMTYNRCIGTRYCANNCPYKVRRFNWLDYTTADIFGMNDNYNDDENLKTEEGISFMADNLTRMVLNPDVTVRSRGVIEKCSFCVQRIQEGKLTAKREGRKLVDADVRTACQTACPTGAITFGDRNIAGGDVAEKIENPLNYLVLEEINTQPGVFYAAKVNNRSEELDA